MLFEFSFRQMAHKCRVRLIIFKRGFELDVGRQWIWEWVKA
jgi:hypothetical protein